MISVVRIHSCCPGKVALGFVGYIGYGTVLEFWGVFWMVGSWIWRWDLASKLRQLRPHRQQNQFYHTIHSVAIKRVTRSAVARRFTRPVLLSNP
jgi:hypothetical protein